MNSFIDECFANKLLNTNDRYLINRVLTKEPYSDIHLAKLSDLAKFTGSQEAEKTPEEKQHENEHEDDEESKHRNHMK